MRPDRQRIRMAAGRALRAATRCGAACLIASSAACFALGPHELLLLVNEDSPDSVEIANAYARLRQVPPANIVRLRLPEAASRPPFAVSLDEFTHAIWEPATHAARERGLDDHIMAWVYSAGFPTRVAGEPGLSIHGLTFVRNRPPDPELAKKGFLVSPLFAGPNDAASVAYASQTMDSFREWLRGEMPLPAMSLGHTGEGGNTRQEVIASLARGARSDATAPDGWIYFVTNRDVRSLCRQWEFPSAVRRLGEMGVHATIVPSIPTGPCRIMGLMTGAAQVDPGPANRFLPGSFGEHLTSLAAVFDVPGQTKVSAWIRAGASGSAGTVVEPLSNWRKFPSGWFFVHYAAGCTLLESVYQAVKCPLQTWFAGDPLAQPWAPAGRAELNGAPAGPAAGAVRLEATARGQGVAYVHFAFFVDGRSAGEGRTLELDTRRLSDGPHTIRAVARRAGLVRSQVFCEALLTVKNGTAPAAADGGDARGVVRELIQQP